MSRPPLRGRSSLIDRVVMDQRAVAPAARAEALRQHGDTLVEFLARSNPDSNRRGAPDRTAHLPATRATILRRQFVESARRAHSGGTTRRSNSPRRTASSSAAHSTSSSRDSGNSLPLEVPPTECPARPTRCKNALIERVEPIWQTRSTSPISMPSSSEAVATKRLQLAALQALLGVEPPVPRETAVMGGDVLLADALRNMARDAFGQAAGVDKNDGGAMLENQFGQPIIDLRPHLARHHRLERRGRKLQSKIAAARMAAVDDRAGVASRAAARRRRSETAPLPRSAFALPTIRCAPAAARRAPAGARARAPDAHPRLLPAMA